MSGRSIAGHVLSEVGMKRRAAVALSAAGLGGLRSGDLGLDVSLFMRRSRRQLEALGGVGGSSRVLLTGGFGFGPPFSLISSLVARALWLRGADARVLQCDAALKACELLHASMFSDSRSFLQADVLPSCAGCLGVTRTVFDGFQMPRFLLGSYVSESDYRRGCERGEGLSLREIVAYRHDGLDLGEHVRTSLHRFFVSGELQDDELTRLTARRFLASALALAQAMGRVIAEWRPDVVVAHHGVYLIGGVTCELARREGIRVVAWDTAYRRHSLVVSHGQTYHHELREEPTENWENESLSVAQQQTLDRYFGQRRLGRLGLDDLAYNAGNETDQRRIIDDLGLDLRRRLVVLFPNVIWDGRVSFSSQIYDGPIAWMVDSIGHLAGRNDVQVAVRIHPAEVREVSWKGLQRVEDEIRKLLPTLPPNAILVAPERRVNSYVLADLAHLCVVYASKIGLEALLMRRPVVIIGDGFYGNKGFGMQPASRKEYLQLLDDLESIQPPGEQEMVRIRRYAYHYFFRRQIQIPFFYHSGRGAPVAGSVSDLLPGKSEGLDRLCQGILRGRPFHVGAP